MDGKRVRRMVESLRGRRPRDRRELAAYVRAFLGLKVPGRRVCAGHDSPMDYLAYAVLGEDGASPTLIWNDSCQRVFGLGFHIFSFFESNFLLFSRRWGVGGFDKESV